MDMEFRYRAWRYSKRYDLSSFPHSVARVHFEAADIQFKTFRKGSLRIQGGEDGQWLQLERFLERAADREN